MGKTVKAVVGIGLAVVGVVTANPGLIVMGLSMTASALITPKVKQGQRQASITNLTIGEVPREAVLGEAVTGGSLADAFNYGGKYGTDWEVLVVALADHECDSLVGFYVNDQYVAFVADGMVAGYNNQLAVYFRHGTESQTAPAILATNGPGWTADDRGVGICYVVAAYKADASDAQNPIYPAGRPAFRWRLKGAKCYVARQDSTVAGGSGDHRRNTPATWTWTQNLIDCRYSWVRGIYACNRVTDPTMLLIGRGLNAVEAPPENTFAPANLCDETVDGEPRYRIGGVVRADDVFINVEEMFAAACGGVIIQPEGSVEIEPGQAKAAVAYITDDDLVVGSSVDYSEFLPRSDDEWFNTVVPRYVEPAQNWADHGAPIRRLNADVIADGGPREEVLNLPLVTSEKQAGRVGEIRRRFGRLWKRAGITLGPPHAELEDGDWIVWTSQRYFHGASITFRVEGYDLDKAWQNRLQLREITASVFSAGAFIANAALADQPGALPSIGAPGGAAWSLQSEMLDNGGPAIPILAITGAVDDSYARAIRFEYWRDDGVTDPEAVTDWITLGDHGAGVTRAEVSTIASGADYYAAVSYVVGGIPGDRLILGPVTAGIMTAGMGALLTNESHTLPADSAGVVTSYAGATGEFIIFAGADDVSGQFTLATKAAGGNPQGLTVSYNNAVTPRTYAVTAGFDAGEANATLTIRATGTGVYSSVIIDKVLSLAKSPAGASGAPAKLMTVSSDRQIISYDETGALSPASQTTTFTANKQNTTNTVAWTLTDSLGNVLTPATYLSATTGNSVTMTAANFSAAIAVNGAQGVIVTATIAADSLSDKISVLKVQKGATGAAGANAKAITVDNDREAFTFDGGGNLSPGSQSSIVTANPQNLVGGAVVWSYADNLGTASATLAALVTNTSANVRTVPSTVFTGTPTRQWLRVTATGQGAESALSDATTLYRLDAGASVLAMLLSNEAHNVPTDAAGGSGDFAGAVGQIKVFWGTTDVTATTTLSEVSETGCTGDVNTATNTPFTGAKGAYRVTAMSADTATYRMRAVYNPGSGNVTVDRDFTLAKTKTGLAGADGSQAWTPILSTNMARSGTTFSKTGSTGSWNAGFRSAEGFIGARVSFKASQVWTALMVGLNSDPATDEGYVSIDWALYCLGDGGTLYAFESGAGTVLGTYATTDILSVEQIGTTIQYKKNGVVLRTVTGVRSDQLLYADSSFNEIGSVNSVTVGGTSSGAIPSPGTNRVRNGDAELGTTDFWVINETSGSIPVLSVATSGSYSGTQCFAITKLNVGYGGAALGRAIPVRPGQVFTYRCPIKGDSATSNGFYMRVNEKNAAPTDGQFVTAADRSSSTDMISNGPVTTSWANTAGFIYTVPAGVYWISPAIYNWGTGPLVLYLDQVEFFETPSEPYIMGPTDLIVQTDSAGAIISGQLDQVWVFNIVELGANVTTGVTWTRTTPAGLTTTLTGSGSGNLQATAFGGNDVEVELSAARAGKTTLKFKVRFRKDPQPAAATATSFQSQTSGFNSVSSGTAAVISGELQVVVGASGVATFAAALTVKAARSSPIGTWKDRFQWERWNGSSWVTQGSTFDASDTSVDQDGESGLYYISATGSASSSQTYSAGAGATLKMRLTAWTVAGSSTNTTKVINITGQISLQG